jgi:hypothetical protein
MATKYYVDLHIAGQEDQEDHVRVGLVDSIPELADAYVEGCRILQGRGATAGDQVIWCAVAKENEHERDLTSVEEAALTATFEQKFPDTVVLPPTDLE